VRHKKLRLLFYKITFFDNLRTTMRIFALLTILLLRRTLAQQRPSLNATKFDRSVSYRNNYCDVLSQVYGNVVKLPFALKGRNLNLAFVDYTSTSDESIFFGLNEMGEVKRSDAGLFVMLIDELATRAGFTWRDSFAAIPLLNSEEDGNRTWTELLLWTTDTYDVAVDFFAKTPERIALGVSFPEGWYDSSVILVGRSGEGELSLFSFFRPFTVGVWLMIGVFIVFTGLLYWFLARVDTVSDARDLGDKPLSAIFLASLAFTSNFEFRPNTASAQLMAFSWSFWALIVGAAYTANLANFLINRERTISHVTNLNQAVLYQTPICMKKSTAHEEYVKNFYPDANLIPLESHEDTFLTLQAGDCELVATQEDTFRLFQNSMFVNKQCNLKRIGRTEQIRNGGFATSGDNGDFCTSVVSQVLDYHLLQMKADGFIEDALNSFGRSGGHVCESPTALAMNKSTDSNSLNVHDMGGIFLFHAIICVVALACSLLRMFHRRRAERFKNANDKSNCEDNEHGENKNSLNSAIRRRSSLRHIKEIVLGKTGDHKRSIWQYADHSIVTSLRQVTNGAAPGGDRREARCASFHHDKVEDYSFDTSLRQVTNGAPPGGDRREARCVSFPHDKVTVDSTASAKRSMSF